MRTGGDYRKALRDGRKLWVMGEGRVDDVTTHPATRAMVEEYALWYDRHLDPAWHELLLAPPNADGARIPWAYVLPRSADELIGMGRLMPAGLRSEITPILPGHAAASHQPAASHLGSTASKR